MRRLSAFLATFFISIGLAGAAQAALMVAVDKSEQLMRVYVDGSLAYVWPVSTARMGYRTPLGSYRPYALYRFHRSRIYDNAPMPYSIFFNGGYAIHGTYAIRRLGSPASHGCIRLHIENARELFGLVSEFGREYTRIVIRP